MRSQTLHALSAGLLAVVNFWNIADGANAVPWAPDLPTAQKQAAQQGKLVLMHFWSPDCAPCLRLQNTVFADPTVGDIVSRDFVPVKVNGKKFLTLAYQYGVKGWPTDVVTTPDGRAIRQPMVTPQDSHQFTAALSQIAANERVYGVGRAGDSAATRSVGPPEGGLPSHNRAGGLTQGASPSRFRSYNNYPAYDSNRPVGDPAGYAASPPARDWQDESSRDTSFNAVPERRPAEPKQPPAPAEVYNQYASQRYDPASADRRVYGNSPAGTRQPPAQTPAAYGPGDAARSSAATDYASRQLEPANRYGQVPRGSSGSPPAPNREQDRFRQDRYQAVAGPEAGAYGARQPMGRPAAGQQPSWSTDAKNRPVESGGRATGGRDAATLNSGGPTVAPNATQTGSNRQPSPSSRASANLPWGLDGYCPVVLVEQGKWVKGDPRWGVGHRGRTYLFTSVNAKQRFWANPDRYAPALSGIDPVLFSENDQQVEGKRNHGVVYRDHVYLFASEQSLQRFWRAPERFEEQVRQAMSAAGEGRQWR